MSNSHRQNLVAQVVARMQTILTSGGYETNIGSKVYEWKITAWEAGEVPGVAVRDYEEEVDHKASDKDYPRMKVQIEAAFESESDMGAYARKVLADITKAVGTDVNWSSGGTRLAQYTKNLGNKFQIEQKDETIGVVTVELEIGYRLKEWDPYTNPGQ